MKKILGPWIFLDWGTMSYEEKLRFKRLCLLPLFAYAVYIFLKLYTPFIVLLIIGALVYRHFEKGKLKK